MPDRQEFQKSDMQEFQVVGESYRRTLGIDGTAGDAQDTWHPYTVDERYPGCCIVCGLAKSYRKHQSQYRPVTFDDTPDERLRRVKMIPISESEDDGW